MSSGEITPPWGGAFSGRRGTPVFDHASCQPSPDHVPGGKQPNIGEQPVVVNVVERSGQVGIENP